MPFAINSGINIHYRIEGEGPPLVLQHGFAGNLDRWRMARYVDALKNTHQLILLDARGHGASDKPHDSSAYSWDVRVKDIVAVLDHLDLQSADFWGYSMGGLYAFNLAKYAADRVNSLIIGGASPYAANIESFRNVDGTDVEEFFTALESVVGERITPEGRDRMLDNDFKALAAAIVADRGTMEQILPTMTMPCLVYVGDDDSRYRQALTYIEKMPNVEFLLLSGCNHMQAYMRSDLILPSVKSFLNR